MREARRIASLVIVIIGNASIIFISIQTAILYNFVFLIRACLSLLIGIAKDKCYHSCRNIAGATLELTVTFGHPLGHLRA